MFLENFDRAVAAFAQVALEGGVLELVLLKAPPLREGGVTQEALVLARGVRAGVVGEAGLAGEAARALLADETGAADGATAVLADVALGVAEQVEGELADGALVELHSRMLSAHVLVQGADLCEETLAHGTRERRMREAVLAQL